MNFKKDGLTFLKSLGGPLLLIITDYKDLIKLILTPQNLVKFMLVGLISFFISVIYKGGQEVRIMDEYIRVEKPYMTYDLKTLDADNQIEGKSRSMFFVGSGYVREELYYQFYVNTPKGIEYIKVSAEDKYPGTYIIETDSIKPKYVRYGEFYADSTKKYYTSKRINRTRDVLYIPKGSIKVGFKIN